jgi:hypothetical protein
MTQITLPDAALSQLMAVKTAVSVVDAAGHPVGTFVPAVFFDAELYRANPSPLTPDERKRRREEGGGKTLAEFWDDMRKKYPDEFK